MRLQSNWRKLLLIVAIFIPVYVLYLVTMPATVYWQDAGIYLGGIKSLGVIYPPGFPLYVFFGWLWAGLLSFVFSETLTLAQQVHAFSGVWGAGAAVLVGLTVYELAVGVFSFKVKKKKSVDEWHILLVSVISGLVAGFSYSLWSQSINAEVYSLAGFFAALLFWGVVQLIKVYGRVRSGELKKRFLYRWLVFLAVVWGLSFANHPVTVVFVPAVLLIGVRLGLFPWQRNIISEKKKVDISLGWSVWIMLSLIFVVLAALPYLYLPIRSAANPEYLWSKIDSMRSLAGHLTGKVYLTRERAVKINPEKLMTYPVLFFQEFFIVGIILGIVGWWKVRKLHFPFRLLSSFVLVFSVVLYVLLSLYERGTEYNLWLIPFYLLFSVFMGFGIWSVTRKRNNKVLLVGILGALIIVPQLAVNLKYLNRRGYRLPQEFGQNLLGNLPENAILFTIGDQSSAIPKYLQTVKGYREDVVLVWGDTFLFDWQRKRLIERYPDLVMPEVEDAVILENVLEQQRVVGEFIYSNLDRRDVFLITKNVVPMPADLFLIPAGTVWKVSRKPDEVIDLSLWDYKFSDYLRYRRPERLEHSRDRKDAAGEVVGIDRLKYSAEARLFELQAEKNLADLCLGKVREGKTLEVRTVEGEIEKWERMKLLECAKTHFEAMLELDPEFYHEGVFNDLSEVYGFLGDDGAKSRLPDEAVRRKGLQ